MLNPVRLFPTGDNIFISPDTNFILLPFQLPTYHKRTQAKRSTYILNPDAQGIDERVHQMDYYTDNPFVAPERKPQQQNIAKYPHLNP